MLFQIELKMNNIYNLFYYFSYDVEAKLNNKLEIKTVGEGSSSDGMLNYLKQYIFALIFFIN